MIIFKSGNLLEAPAEALVNAVGVMGKGIALQFKHRLRALGSPRFIINFPTKTHWRLPSKIEWIQAGLSDLCRKTAKYWFPNDHIQTLDSKSALVSFV